jgi:VCBS repeat-containing protein
VFNRGSITVLTNTTVYANPPAVTGFALVGIVQARNTLLAGNGSGRTCGSRIITLGNNLGDGTDCFDQNQARGDIVAATPLLGPLADNGGPTQTHALLQGSPAIDGVTFDPALDCGPSGGTDQRGVPRPQSRTAPLCDIGAFELEGSVPIVLKIDSQTTLEDTETAAIPFTVVDADTPAASLTVTGSSSNPALVPTGGLVFGGGGNNRTLTITPSPDQDGSADVTVTVSDGSASSSTTFTLSVTPVNDPPANTVPPAQTVSQNGSVLFTTGNNNLISISDVDAGSDPVQLALTATNGSLTLNGTAGLTIVAGADASPSVTVTGTLARINAALNGLRLTPARDFAGPASLQVVTNDLGKKGIGGAQTDTDTVAITVQHVNVAPVAVSDSYTVETGRTLTVSAGSGVLANDTDAEQSPLQAQVVSAPSHGSLDLTPSGAFTYVPAATFAGTDTFTYRASDGDKMSSPSTVNITVAATTVVASACVPRPAVQTAPSSDGRTLRVHVEATPLNTRANNPLQRIDFGALQNARVSVGVQAIASGQTYAVPAATISVDFTVERVTPGQATTVPFSVLDGCGEWKTFVGGGTGAGF